MYEFVSREAEHESNVLDPMLNLAAANDALCELVGEHLARVYPGHPWGIISQIESGIVKICLQGFQQWPVVIHVESLKGDPSMAKVTRYAGELLERLRMPRKGFDLASWQEANKRHNWLFNRNKKAPV